MIAATLLDTVDADAVEVGDFIEVDGIVGEVTDVDDQTDIIVITIEDNTTGEVEQIPCFSTDRVNLFG